MTSCDPNEDIYNELAEIQKEENSMYLKHADHMIAPEAYTLTETDYALSSNEDVSEYKNFSDNAKPADYLAEILNQLFFAEVGTEMAVTFNYYYSSKYEHYTENQIEDMAYEMQDIDYDLLGAGEDQPGEYNNFSGTSDASKYLPYFFKNHFYMAEVGDIQYVRYAIYGTHSDYHAEFEFNGTTWTNTYATSGYDDVRELDDDDYDAMGEGYNEPGDYDNFSSRVKINDFLPDWLLTEYPNATTGDKVQIQYTYYGFNNDYYAGYQLQADGNWTKIIGVSYDWEAGDYEAKTYSKTTPATLTAQYTDNDNWRIVPPIKFIETTKAHTVEYELTEEDYELVGNGKYYNFDIRPDAAEEDLAVRIEKISKILKTRFPELKVGDVYKVTYKIYDGSSGELDIVLEAVEDAK